MEEFMPFSKGNSRRVNLITRLELEIASYDVAVNRISHYVNWTPPAVRDKATWAEYILPYINDNTCRIFKK